MFLMPKSWKMKEKSRKLKQYYAKNMFFEFANNLLMRVLLLEKKQLTSIWMQTQKTKFFLICLNFLGFFPFCVFCAKHKKAYFDQRLECTAPKCWSKYAALTEPILSLYWFSKHCDTVNFLMIWLSLRWHIKVELQIFTTGCIWLNKVNAVS